jgi:hypothetical protein
MHAHADEGMTRAHVTPEDLADVPQAGPADSLCRREHPELRGHRLDRELHQELGIVSSDHRVDSRGGDHGHAVIGDELDDPAVVIRMRVRDEDGHERFRQRLELRAEGRGVGDGQRSVDRDDSLARLDEVRVDERALRSGRVAVDANVRGHAAASSGRPWRSTARS